MLETWNLFRTAWLLYTQRRKRQKLIKKGYRIPPALAATDLMNLIQSPYVNNDVVVSMWEIFHEVWCYEDDFYAAREKVVNAMREHRPGLFRAIRQRDEQRMMAEMLQDFAMFFTAMGLMPPVVETHMFEVRMIVPSPNCDECGDRHSCGLRPRGCGEE